MNTKELNSNLKAYFHILAKEKEIPVDRIVCGMINNEILYWDYDSGRHYQDQWRIIEISIKPEDVTEQK